MRFNVKGLLLTMFWVSLMAFFFAEVEIQIEGDAGWATSLPTWRIEQHWLLDIFWGWACDDRLSRLGISVYRDDFSPTIFLFADLVMEITSTRIRLYYVVLDRRRFSLVCVESSFWIGEI